MTLVLRDYQENCLADARKVFAQGLKRVVIAAPTGSGKGSVSIELARRAHVKGKRVLFLVHRKDLVHQQVERFSHYGIDVGVLQGKNTYRPHSEITVGSIQTYSSRVRFGWIFNFDFVILDECHTVPGSRHYLEFMRLNNNIPMVGFTATPYAKGMGKEHDWGYVFEEMIVAATMPDLIRDGYLVDCDIYAPEKYQPDLSAVTIKSGDYAQDELGKAVDRQALIGDIVKHWKELANGTQTVVFATNIAHSQHICAEFKMSGIMASHIDSYMKEDEVKRVYNNFEEGAITVLCNVGKAVEGWDCPACQTLILARPTKSIIRYIQMIGRVLRPFDGKHRALVLDHSDTCARLGFPTDYVPTVLDDGSVSKSDSKLQEERPKPKPCSNCGYLRITGGNCPQCGHKPQRKDEIEHEHGALKKVEKKATQQEKQSWYSQLLYIARQKGRSKGWVSHTYKDKFSVWPKGLLEYALPATSEVIGYVKHKDIKYAKRKDNYANR